MVQRHTILSPLVCIAALLLCGSGTALDAPTPARATTTASDQAEAEYVQAIDKRSADVVVALAMTDSAKQAKTHELLVTQYRALRAWHDANDSMLKSKTATPEEKAKVEASRKALHDTFLSQLSAELTPEQVEIVKDRMTYNKVRVTYDGYVEIVPGLTDVHKSTILQMLKEAREEAMDGGSAEEKSAVFKKYKGKINNYLSAQGIDVGKAYKDWGARQKAKQTMTTTQATD